MTDNITHNNKEINLNKLRASVLGANDGIVSTAAVMIGVAGATTNNMAILVSAIAAVIGGAVSMSLGEYVSVASQRDVEQGSGIEEEEWTSPTIAAVASFFSFFLGALLPVIAGLIVPNEYIVYGIFVTTLIALGATGALSAYLSKTNITKAVIRLLVGGTIALAITYLTGNFVGEYVTV